MSWFSRLFGPPGPPPSPDALREQLFAARGRQSSLSSLCRRHRDLIRQHFDGWRKLPAEIREDRDQVQAYMDGLVVVAELFEQRFGDPALMGLLLGPPGDNPIVRWQGKLAEASKLKDELRYGDAAQLLTDLLIDVRDLKGSAIETYLPVTLGELGECLFQSGAAARAVAPTRQALDLVRRAGDADGVRAYLGNLYEMYRYLGQREEAAGHAEQLAAQLESTQPDEARRYRNQARLVRAGEPKNRVVLEINQRRYELDEVLEGIEGGVRFHFERDRMTLRPAEVLVERGRKLASQRKYEEALTLFRDAAKADPLSPVGTFDAAVTLMHLGRTDQAIDEYARTEELAPGWFHCRSELWLAQQIVVGRFELPVFEVLRVIEDGGLAPEAQRQMTEQALGKWPDLAPLHYFHGRGLRGQPSAAVKAYRRGLACEEEPDIRTRLLAELGGILDPGEERRRLLEEAVALGGNLVAQATARLVLHFDQTRGG
jgi:tetratricopeptide (TPR) repeat protein